MMESSFKKNYEKTIQQDGSIVLSHPQARLSGVPAIFVFAAICFGCFLAFGMVGTALVGGKGGAMGAVFIVSIALAGFVGYRIAKMLIVGKNVIEIKPGTGLLINGAALPFKDIQYVGVDTLVFNGRESGSSAYATSHGNKIPLTRNVSSTLAQSIADEVKEASGMSWA